MSKKTRVGRSKTDLQQELREQLALLTNSCKSFDSGLEAAGKYIALTLRVLFHNHGKSRSLLEQLKLRDNRYFDTAGPLIPRNFIADMPLLAMHIDNQSATYLPRCLAEGASAPTQKIKFVEWWNNPVLKDQRGAKFSRRELVQHVADTDGGAHVDPELEEAYMNLSRGNSLGWVVSNGNDIEKLKGRPELACIRQIAYETLMSLKEIAPEYTDA